MADPYQLLQANDQRTAQAFDALNRNTIAGFNAKAKAAQFSFSAHMGVAQVQEQARQNDFRNEMLISEQARRADMENKRFALSKMQAGMQMKQQDLQYNAALSDAAQKSAMLQIGVADSEIADLRRQAWFDPEAQAKLELATEGRAKIILDLNAKQQEIMGAMNNNDRDYFAAIDEELSSLHQGMTEDGFDPEDISFEAWKKREGEGVYDNMLPKKPTTPDAKTNNTVVAANQSNTSDVTQMGTDALDREATKSAELLKQQNRDILFSWKPADVTRQKSIVEAGEVISASPSSAPAVASPSISKRDISHARNVLSIDPSTVDKDDLPTLNRARHAAYSKLLLAKDPAATQEYQNMYDLVTNPNTTDANAEKYLDAAEASGMLVKSGRVAWALDRAKMESDTKIGVTNPSDDILKKLTTYTELRSKLIAQGESDTGPDVSVEMLHVNSNIDRYTRALSNQAVLDGFDAKILAHEKAGNAALAEQARIGKSQAISAHSINTATASLNEQDATLRNQGVFNENESLTALAREGIDSWNSYMNNRLRSVYPTASEEQIANLSSGLFTSYSAYGDALGTQTANGRDLPAPASIDMGSGQQIMPSTTVVDNTLGGIISNAFKLHQPEDLTLRDQRRKVFTRELGSIKTTDKTTLKELSDKFISGSGRPTTEEGIMVTSQLDTGGLAMHVNKWDEDEMRTIPGIADLVYTANDIADERTNKEFSGELTAADFSEIENGLAKYGIKKRFDLSTREGYHGAIKRITAMELAEKLKNFVDNNK